MWIQRWFETSNVIKKPLLFKRTLALMPNSMGGCTRRLQAQVAVAFFSSLWVCGMGAQTLLKPELAVRVDTPSPDDRALGSDVNAQMDLQLEELRAQKTQIQHNYEQQNAACLKKFAVTGCKTDALKEKNALMAVLKKQEAQIAEQQKRLRSEQKLKDLDERQSPQELERIKERTRLAELAFEDRQAAHEQRLSEHERQLSSKVQTHEPPIDPQKAKDRQTRTQNAQDAYDQKIKAAKEHREDLRKRLETKTVHPVPLVLPQSVQPPKNKIDP
jgi:colicin import membrane protein